MKKLLTAFFLLFFCSHVYSFQAVYPKVCSFCKGTTHKTCSRCDGNGKRLMCLICKGNDLTKEKCDQCEGRDLTKLPCWFCNGHGRIQKREVGNNTCPLCEGSGRQDACLWCNGSGYKLPCYNCNGQDSNSSNKCYVCNGSGKEVCNFCNATGIEGIDLSSVDTQVLLKELNHRYKSSNQQTQTIVSNSLSSTTIQKDNYDANKTVHVKGYRKKNGTYVDPYNRRPPHKK